MRSYILLLIIATTLLMPDSSFAADRCKRANYIFTKGTGCTLRNVRPGEWVTIIASYHESRKVDPDDWATIIIPEYNLRYTLRHNGRRVFKFVATTDTVTVNYIIPAYDDEDYLSIEGFTSRTNLKIKKIHFDDMTGDLAIDYHIGPGEEFIPTDWVGIELHSGSGRKEHLIKKWWLDECIGTRECSGTKTIKGSEIFPLQDNDTQLFADIDPHNRYPETTGRDNSVSRNPYFYVEYVPSIMETLPGSYAQGWDVSSRLLKTWLEGQKKIKNPSIDTVDFKLDTKILFDTTWLFNRTNALDNRVEDAYHRLLSEEYLFSKNARRVLKDRIRKAFEAEPGLAKMKLSQKLNEINPMKGESLVETYHSQQMQYVEVQRGGRDALFSPLDAITGALGGWSLYAVPFGIAKKQPDGKIIITVRKIAIHTIDSFDFNGIQPLGCWGRNPSYLSKLEHLNPFTSNPRCLWNKDYRDFRARTKRGTDFSIFSTPYSIPLTQPKVIAMRPK